MALRGVKATSVEKRLKVLFYGQAGVGKTTAAINFPKPYIIDTERGSENNQYTKLLDKNGGMVFHCTDFDDVIKEVKSLISEKHEFKTIIIDPFTTIYNNLLDSESMKVGTDYGKHYGEANKKSRQLINLLIRLDMNVIITMHSKNEYMKQGKELLISGQTFDGYKKLDYLFDLVIEVKKKGKDRQGIVKKTRIEKFEEGESFNFCYEKIAEKYGKSILEKDSESQQLASKDQIQKIKRLSDLLNLQELIDKTLTKYSCSQLDELPFDVATKFIEFLHGKVDTIKPDEIDA